MDKTSNSNVQNPSALGKRQTFNDSKFHLKIERMYPKLRGKYTEKEWRKLYNAFWDKAGDILIHQPNGIVLDGLGYFAFPAYNKRTKRKNGETTFLSKGNYYYPQFFGVVFKDIFVRTLSFEMSRNLSRKWKDLVRGGMNYLFLLDYVKRITGNGFKYLRPTRRIYR